MREVHSFDGASLAVHDTGPADAPAVLLLHGLSVDAQLNWGRTGVIAALLDAGFRVVAPDARGHGASEGRVNEPGFLDAMVADALAIVAAFQLSPVLVGGYSMGAGIGLRVTEVLCSAGRGAVTGAYLGGIGARSLSGRTPEGLFAHVDVPVVIATGADDAVAGEGPPLATAFPRGRALVLEGDHLMAVADPAFTTGLVDLARELSP